MKGMWLQLKQCLNPFSTHVELSLLHQMAVKLKEKYVFVCRECSAVGRSGCWISTDCAHLPAAQHPRAGALGGGFMLALLYR